MRGQTHVDRTATGGAQAIRRAIDTVRLVAQIQRSGANLSRVARAAGLKTSTAFRILRTLTEERLLRYDHVERCYYVGPLAFELGLAASAEAQAQMSWRDAVERIARETRLTTYLMARSDKDAVCLLCVQGSTALRAMPVEVGQRLPLGIGAGSLAILATLDDEEVRRIVSAQESRLDLFPDGKAKAKGILKRVDLTRQRGFSISSGTVVPGVTGVGVAILPHQGLAQLALSVSAVASSIDPREARKIASVIAAAIQSHRGSHGRRLGTIEMVRAQ
jgi:DNA-binding IclR family transcriptional regulator